MSIPLDWNIISTLLPSLCTVLSKEVNDRIHLFSNSIHSPSSNTDELFSMIPDLSSFNIDFRFVNIAPPQVEKDPNSKPNERSSMLESLLCTSHEYTVPDLSSMGPSLRILNVAHPDPIFFTYLQNDKGNILFKNDQFTLSNQQPSIDNINTQPKQMTNDNQPATNTNLKMVNFIDSFVPKRPTKGSSNLHWSSSSNSTFSKLSTAIRGWSLLGLRKSISEDIIEGRCGSSNLTPSISSSPLDIQIEISLNLSIECDIVAKGTPGIDIPGFGISSLVSLPIEATLSGMVLDLPLTIAIIGIEDLLNNEDNKKITLFGSVSRKEPQNTPTVSLKLDTILGDSSLKKPLKSTKKIEQFLEDVINLAIKENMTMPKCLKLEIENFSNLKNFANILNL